MDGTLQTRRLALTEIRGSVGRSREFTRTALEDWGWLPAAGNRLAVTEDVLLMVSELITNACLHAGGPRELVLHRTGALLRVEVTDESPFPPVIRPGGHPAVPGGHGLKVVDRLSRGWGSEPGAVGKTVWLEIEVPPP
ncbi:ATP-binding protein [Kitasatospora camelliae]|uniref:ATP-binding protein n=1 Tax=Kitasatospora camelliae TaxID=3156397 RepID=A0AAU8JQV5_9ACTN